MSLRFLGIGYLFHVSLKLIEITSSLGALPFAPVKWRRDCLNVCSELIRFSLMILDERMSKMMYLLTTFMYS